jgi:hypothetical protein
MCEFADLQICGLKEFFKYLMLAKGLLIRNQNISFSNVGVFIRTFANLHIRTLV